MTIVLVSVILDRMQKALPGEGMAVVFVSVILDRLKKALSGESIAVSATVC